MKHDDTWWQITDRQDKTLANHWCCSHDNVYVLEADPKLGGAAFSARASMNALVRGAITENFEGELTGLLRQYDL